MPRLNIIPAACTVALYNMATNAKNDIRSRMEEGDDEKHLYELLQALKRSSRNPGASRNPEEEFAEEVLFANETNNVLKRIKTKIIKDILKQLRTERKKSPHTLSLPGLPLPSSSPNSVLEVAYILSKLFGDDSLASSALPSEATLHRPSALLQLSLSTITPKTLDLIKSTPRRPFTFG